MARVKAMGRLRGIKPDWAPGSARPVVPRDASSLGATGAPIAATTVVDALSARGPPSATTATGVIDLTLDDDDDSEDDEPLGPRAVETEAAVVEAETAPVVAMATNVNASDNAHAVMAPAARSSPRTEGPKDVVVVVVHHDQGGDHGDNDNNDNNDNNDDDDDDDDDDAASESDVDEALPIRCTSIETAATGTDTKTPTTAMAATAAPTSGDEGAHADKDPLVQRVTAAIWLGLGESMAGAASSTPADATADVESEEDEALPCVVVGVRPPSGNSAESSETQMPEDTDEDEALPRSRGPEAHAPRPVPERRNDNGDDDDVQLVNDDEAAAGEQRVDNASADDDARGSIDEDAVDDAGPNHRIVELLEDGEIFEEGAVIKSPTAVKAAIAVELQASRNAEDLAASAAGATKKKQKKRGRKKSKRKLEALEAGGFERNVRVVPAIGHGPPPHNALAPPPPYGPPPMFAPPAMQPPLHLPHRAPMGPVGMPFPHQPTNPVALRDERIVRVHRHGVTTAVEGGPVQFSGIMQPPEPRLGGFPYVPLDHFTGNGVVVSSTGLGPRGHNRPALPVTRTQRDEPMEDDAVDLDSLRAAALRTKRKTASGSETDTITQQVKTVASATSSSSSGAESSSEETETLGDKSDSATLSQLREELLKSMIRKSKLRPPQPPKCVGNESGVANGPSPSSSTIREVEVDGDCGNNSKHGAAPHQPMAPQRGQQPLQSPQIRPLTALTQSVVIRLSSDDISELMAKKGRTDSLDNGPPSAWDGSKQSTEQANGNPLVKKASSKSLDAKHSASTPASVPRPSQSRDRAALMSAIEQMKQRIAEKEKLTKRNALTSPQKEDVGTVSSQDPVELSSSVPVISTTKARGDSILTMMPEERSCAEFDLETCHTELAKCITGVSEAEAHIARLNAVIEDIRKEVSC